MGNKNNKLKCNKNETKIGYNSSKKIPNIKYFKKKDIICQYKCLNFEVYQLKAYINTFYIALLLEPNVVRIFKYLYKKKIYKEIYHFNLLTTDNENLMMMEHYYDPLDNKDYLFFAQQYDDIQIYLIKSEKIFELVNKKEYLENSFINELRNSITEESFISFFETFYNSYEMIILKN